eukprot:g24455.t1
MVLQLSKSNCKDMREELARVDWKERQWSESEDDILSLEPEMELETIDTQESLQDSLQDSFLETTEDKVRRLWHVLRTAVYESTEK